ncbi:hypothetical protein EIP91_007972 [Steccherinum ochraceum]|uniref:Fungal-type protein kinase domain-containing protein n=1 Tax=Steccherinum ochraceum TaxID=92696 RepID=A0A4R0R3I7_9APHY|nr:hypothetical protein EIP91_007972 [Steccherinum ochraceum]
MEKGRTQCITATEHLNELIPGDDLPDDFPLYDFTKIPESAFKAGHEKRLYPYLCEAINTATDDSRLQIRDTGDWPEKGDGSIISQKRPDLGMYESGTLQQHELTKKDRKRSTANKKRFKWASRLQWALLRVFIEVKTYTDQTAPFFGSDSDASRMSRGQIAEYIAEIMVRQHRTHVYCVTIRKNTALFMLCDRAGIVACHEFDYIQDPRTFLTFFYRLGRMSDAQLGFDTTVRPVVADHPDLTALAAFKKTIKLPHHQRYYTEAFESGAAWPIQHVTVTEGQKKYRYLIGRPRHITTSPFGRGTKGYVAYDPVNNVLVFYKTYWRPDTKGITPESDIYRTLNAKGVSNVATLLCGGDVSSDSPSDDGATTVLQRTRAQKYLPRHQTPRVHHRLVLKEVARPLEEYENSFELCRATYGALCGHESAYSKAGILHRDVSSGNILIDDSAVDANGKPQPRGMLNDWDMSKTEEQLREGPSQGGRSGTWIFMSGLLLNYPRKPFELSDDMESFIHVLLWNSLRFHEHTFTGRDVELSSLVHSNYEAYHDQGADIFGPKEKMTTLQAGIVRWNVNQQICPAFHQLIIDLIALCKTHYDAVDYTALEKYGAQKDLPSGQADEALIDVAAATAGLQPPRRRSNKASVRTVAPAVVFPPPEPLLASHDELMEVLFNAISRADLRWREKDKIADQLKRLRLPGMKETSKPSSVPQSPRLPGSTAGRKRKAAVQPAEPGRASVKQKMADQSSKSRRTADSRSWSNLAELKRG